METMSALDAAFLHVEDAVTPMHIGMAAIFEGPIPDQASLLAAVASRLHHVPRYRQRVRFAPFAVARPMWSDDPHFRLEYHVRRTALPSPGSEIELRALVGRVMEQRLDRERPLWEMWAVEGLEDGHWGLIMKVHHCMVDGIAATDLLDLLLDHDGTTTIDPPVPWQPAPEPAALGKLGETVAATAAGVADGGRSIARAALSPRKTILKAAAFVSGMANYATVVRTPPPLSLNGPVGLHRRWFMARASLADVKQVRAAYGCTVNDVVLAAITQGFRELLLARGESVEGRVVRTFVPVSVRTDDHHDRFNNEVSAVFADLPVWSADPIERLNLVHQTMDRLKHSGEAYAGKVLTELGGWAPALGWALGNQIGTRTPQRFINTVTTNIPGPQMPWFLQGRRMLELFPYVPVGGHMRTIVAIYSYDGNLAFGITGDEPHSGDLDVLCAGIESGMRELVEASAGAGEAHDQPRHATR
jgi:WS/DGAT/MGAT family acyltransferase